MYQKVRDLIRTHAVTSVGVFAPTPSSPDYIFAEILADVQEARLFNDGKTFVDMIPRSKPRAIAEQYKLNCTRADFDLRSFIEYHFVLPESTTSEVYAAESIDAHISQLWDVLKRKNHTNKGSLLALPHTYIVPGGRFSEQFYWDSYFIMLGLAVDNRLPEIKGMMKNYAYMIRKWGYIPTANRTYLLSRSQPPYFASMIQLLAHTVGEQAYLEYLPYVLSEYKWWTGLGKRVVEMSDGTHLQRYYDADIKPRPESYAEDVEVAKGDRARYVHLRAAAESGWDFSSRWCDDPHDLATTRTADIVPIDLNCLLYEMECTLAYSYKKLKLSVPRKRFEKLAQKRYRAIQAHLWNDALGTFCDYGIKNDASMSRVTAAMMYALYHGVASVEQAERVVEAMKRELLKQGGIVTTTLTTDQQWDAPNGWAPLQWVTVVGLRRYGYDALADDVRDRWMWTNEAVFREQGKCVEKYDVVDARPGGGGEYPLQDGFGWTNGVYAAFKNELDVTISHVPRIYPDKTNDN